MIKRMIKNIYANRLNNYFRNVINEIIAPWMPQPDAFGEFFLAYVFKRQVKRIPPAATAWRRAADLLK